MIITKRVCSVCVFVCVCIVTFPNFVLTCNFKVKFIKVATDDMIMLLTCDAARQPLVANSFRDFCISDESSFYIRS